MKIQLINYSGGSLRSNKNISLISKLNKPQSLDEFDINIIDLDSDKLWENDANSISSVNEIQDFINLRIMIERRQKSTIIILLPQNREFQYYYNCLSFNDRVELKNYLDIITNNIISKLIPESIPVATYNLFYENTITEIEGLENKSAFNFVSSNNILTKSRDSEKITTIQPIERFIFTTLDVLTSEEKLMAFLKKCNLILDIEEYPQWLLDYKILNDDELSDLVTEKETLIKNAQEDIKNAEDGLNSNLEYKSILFTNDKPLATQVFKILEQILDIDLSGFKDEKKEDFLIELEESYEFIGEIKGITSNVRNGNISQLDVHYQNRVDKLEDEKIEKEVKALLIINPLKTTPINDREPVNKDQIELAERNKSLIITTKSLLNIYELFISEKLITNKCIEMFKNEIGLLTDEIIEKYCE